MFFAWLFAVLSFNASNTVQRLGLVSIDIYKRGSDYVLYPDSCREVCFLALAHVWGCPARRPQFERVKIQLSVATTTLLSEQKHGTAATSSWITHFEHCFFYSWVSRSIWRVFGSSRFPWAVYICLHFLFKPSTKPDLTGNISLGRCFRRRWA